MSFRIKHYSAQLGNKRIRRIDDVNIEYYAFILCKDGAGKYLSIYFLAPGSPKVENRFIEQGTGMSRYVAQMFLPVDQYEWYIDLLRNEKPVHAMISMSAPKEFRVGVYEPTGEGEPPFPEDI